MNVTNIFPARRLQLYDVVNDAGHDLGQVQEYMLDLRRGSIAFVVVAFGGVLGLTDKWFALPWELLEWSRDREKFICHMPREVLESAPGLDKKAWPKEIDLSWVKSCYAHFGCTPHWDEPIVTEEHKKRLAFSIWETEGRLEGNDLEHYYRAERMLREEESRMSATEAAS